MNLKIALSLAIMVFFLSIALLCWAVFSTTGLQQLPFYNAKPTFTPPPSFISSPHPVATKGSSFKVMNSQNAQPIEGALLEVFLKTEAGEKQVASALSNSLGQVLFQLPENNSLCFLRTKKDGYKPCNLENVPLPTKDLEVYLDPDDLNTKVNSPANPRPQSTIPVSAFFTPDNSQVKQNLSGSVSFAWYELKSDETFSPRWYLSNPFTQVLNGSQICYIPTIKTDNPLILSAFGNGMIAESQKYSSFNGIGNSPILMEFFSPQDFSIAITDSKTRQPIENASTRFVRLRTPRVFEIQSDKISQSEHDGIVRLKLFPGDYKIDCYADGYSTHSMTLNKVCISTFLLDVQLTKQEPGVEITLIENGKRMKQVPITLLFKDADSKQESKFLRSDENGKVFLKDLPALTTCTVIATHPSNALRQKSIDLFTSGSGSFIAKTITFEKLVRIGGTAKCKDNTPFPSNKLRFIPRGFVNATENSQISPNGIWTAEVEPGEYVIQPEGITSKSDIIKVTDADSMKQYDLEF